MEIIKLADLEIQVEKKDIKNIHLGVYPPEGRVRVAVPLSMDNDEIRIYLISKIDWIKKQQTSFLAQERETQREYISYETHYFLGKRYLLKVIEVDSAPKVVLQHEKIELYIRPNTDEEKRQILLEEWYRVQLKEIVPEYIAKWESLLNVKVEEFFIKKMKTRWGTCNRDDKRIWLNLELAKKNIEYIEYVIVHEMVHLLEATHSKNFISKMNRYFPQWKELQENLGRQPLGHAEW